MHPLGDVYFCTGIILGEGASAVVYKGFHMQTGELVAIKKIRISSLTPHMRTRLIDEVQVMDLIGHCDYIVNILDRVISDDYLSLILEYCKYGDLEEFISKHGNLSYNQVVEIFQGLVSGLRVLQSKKPPIIHRDLKPENILVTDINPISIKICDFTFAKQLKNGDLTHTYCGSPLYMAPEILKIEEYNGKADLWSVGIILYRLLFNTFPWKALSGISLIEKINTQGLHIPENNFPESAINLIRSLLQKDHYNRISWSEFFRHDFFVKDTTSSLLESKRFISLSVQYELEKYKRESKESKERIDYLEEQNLILSTRLESLTNEVDMENSFREADNQHLRNKVKLLEKKLIEKSQILQTHLHQQETYNEITRENIILKNYAEKLKIQILNTETTVQDLKQVNENLIYQLKDQSNSLSQSHIKNAQVDNVYKSLERAEERIRNLEHALSVQDSTLEYFKKECHSQLLSRSGRRS
eukprot:TRINITY_DN7871_c0_g1_i2.p1 TRINITY_DN7871_c0_g1~~TRINITY_DN7871_c0_g1_i2.p1  ORF type:complete len:472 (-),score=70.17 TRINITY_DN7871_c0_g1_i2:52-1467(-)